MGKHRSSYSPQLKAQVALEALRGERSQAAISRIHNLSGEVVSRWRQQVVQGAAEVFASPAGTSAEQQRIAELERLVGELTLELSVVKKSRPGWPLAPAELVVNRPAGPGLSYSITVSLVGLSGPLVLLSLAAKRGPTVAPLDRADHLGIPPVWLPSHGERMAATRGRRQP